MNLMVLQHQFTESEPVRTAGPGMRAMQTLVGPGQLLRNRRVHIDTKQL